MTVIRYQEINGYLKKPGNAKIGADMPVCLLFGEEVLCKSGLELLLDALMPARERAFNYEPLEGVRENVPEAVARLNTYSLGGGMKVVSLLDSQIFSHQQEDAELLDAAPDASGVLVDALEHGFPKNHHLFITAETADKRRRLFKLISNIGLVVDCSVPKGDRRADKAAQDSVLSMKAADILGRYGKRMSGAAYAALCDMTGFDLRTFENNLLKLVDYSGENREIAEADVLFVLRRTKQDPIWDFTNAATDKKLDDALFYLGSLLASGFHPLQMLAALVNQFRRLAVVKSFSENLPDGVWRADAPYPLFQKSVLPLALAHDRKLLDRVAGWEESREEVASAKETVPPAGGPSKTKKVAATDLLVVPNPNSPYPAYKAMQKAGRFSSRDLVDILEALCRADNLLKSTDHSPRSVLETLVITICGGVERV